MTTNSDFADWFSPMLVKELRQGMRSRLFVISFLILQVALIFVAIIGLSMADKEQSARSTGGFFWTLVGVPLLLVMPLGGLGVIGNERKANTLELIFLTHLSPRRIVVGKWIAIVAQTVLLVCTVLPYAVLRYFLGGVDLGSDLLVLGTLLFFSAVLSGVAVGFSPLSGPLSRVFLAVLAIVALQILPSIFFGYGGLGAGTKWDWHNYVCLGVAGFIAAFLMVEFGAARIAPRAENHTTTRRLTALVVVAGVALLGRNLLWGTTVWVCGLFLVAPICVGGLCEPIRDVPSVYRPFTRFGILGRIAGRFLYPGWASGLLFSLVVFGGLFFVGYARDRGTTEMIWICWAGVAAAGTLYFPAAIVRTFLPRTRRPLFIYVGIQIILCLLTALGAALQSNAVDIRPLIAPLPTCGLLLSGGKGITSGDAHNILVGMSFVTGASIVALLVKAPWRQLRALEKATTPGLNPDAADPAPAR